MNCPKCGTEMEGDVVKLEPGGMSIMSFAAIDFGNERLWRESYSGWLLGKRRSRDGFRCKACDLVVIELSREGV